MNYMEHPLVSVVVCTYNQEKWIRQTLDCILGQKTEYTFEVVIGEDWGSDGTRAICEEYVRKYKNVQLVAQDHNLGVTANWVNCVRHSSGKYLMECGGDDFWHNVNKIQMQVDYMEGHPECVVCHTDIDLLNVVTGGTIKSYKQSKGIAVPQGRIQREILSGKAGISAVTLCMRKSCIEKHVPLEKFAELQFPREDWPTLLILSAYGDVMYLPESTATYRVGHESITRMSDYEKIRERLQKDKRMTEYLYTLFPEWGTFKDGPWFDNIANHQMMLAAYRNGDFRSARKFAIKDVYPSIATYMAYTRLSYILYRKLLLRK